MLILFIIVNLAREFGLIWGDDDLVLNSPEIFGEPFSAFGATRQRLLLAV